MAISLYTSAFVFIDSSSYPNWAQCTDVGPVAMRAQGEGLEQAYDDILNTSYVTEVGLVETANAFLRMDKNDVYIGSPDDPLNPIFLVVGNAYSLSDEFLRDFPNEFELVAGRYPKNSSEIAIAFEDALYWGIHIGREMNYTHTLNGIKRTVFVVGIFELSSEDPIRYVITDAIAIVTSDVLNPDGIDTLAYVNVDRSILSPVNPRASLELLNEIESKIASANPTGEPYSRFYVDNYLAHGIQSYIDNLNLERTRQVSRLQLLFPLSGIFAFLGARFNVMLREEIVDYQKMRGASRRRIVWSNMGELLALSAMASIIAIPASYLLSRVGWLSEGYLVFGTKALDYPTLISLDTLAIVCFSVLIIPAIGYAAHIMMKGTVKIDSEKRRLARLAKNLKLLQWDLTIYSLIGILILVLYLGNQSISQNQALLLIANFVPIPLFLAVASLLTKGTLRLSKPISRVFGPIIGKIPASTGMRDISYNDRLAVPTVLILALVLSSVLVSSTLATSLVYTHQAQTRYLIGGDLSFRLDNNEVALWNNFSRIISDDENVLSVALVSMGLLSLSEGASGVIEFVAIRPEQYSHVGYTYTGVRLDYSSQSSLLNALEDNPEGAILTEDIASDYSLIPGDTLRVFSLGDEFLTLEFNIAGITEAIPRPLIIGQPTSNSIIGTSKIWLNRNYIGELMDLNATAETYLCARATEGCNTTDIGEYASTEFGTVILGSNQWSSVTSELNTFQSSVEYSSDRSLDSMISVCMILGMFVTFAVFQANRQRIDKEDRTILRTLGASKILLLKIRLAESFALIFLSLFFIVLFGPIYISNDLRSALLEYSTWSYIFPVAIFAYIDWSSFLLVCTLTLIPSIALILILTAIDSDASIGHDLGDLQNDHLFMPKGESI
jgi:hypothetical protein